MQRIFTEQLDDATEILDEAGIEYDFDSGDRLMLDDESSDFEDACNVLDQNGIQYEII